MDRAAHVLSGLRRRRSLVSLLFRARNHLVARRAPQSPGALYVWTRLLPRSRCFDGVENRCGEPGPSRRRAAVRVRRKPPELFGRRDVRLDLSEADGLGGKARDRTDPDLRMVLP